MKEITSHHLYTESWTIEWRFSNQTCLVVFVVPLIVTSMSSLRQCMSKFWLANVSSNCVCAGFSSVWILPVRDAPLRTLPGSEDTGRPSDEYDPSLGDMKFEMQLLHDTRKKCQLDSRFSGHAFLTLLLRRDMLLIHEGLTRCSCKSGHRWWWSLRDACLTRKWPIQNARRVLHLSAGAWRNGVISNFSSLTHRN